MHSMRFLIPLILLAVSSMGCQANIGASAVKPARQHYSTALGASWNEHLLLNLVRLRYRDTLQFLTVNSVVTQYSFNASGNAGFGFDFEGGNNAAISGGLSYSESPTISYTPLGGEEFVKRLLTPLSPEGLILLANSGWSIERLMMSCVYQINGIENAPSAAGPTPEYPPVFGEFQHLSRLLRELQRARLLRSSVVDEHVEFQILPSDDPALNDKVVEVRKMLSLGEDVRDIQVVSRLEPEAADEIAVVGRSLLGVLFYLSQGVKPPLEHEEGGLVTVTQGDDGMPFDWWDAMSNLLHVSSSKEPPEGAFVKVSHRGYWFYIEDNDLHSKTTWALLTYLFSMQASSGPGGGPLLTLSAN